MHKHASRVIVSGVLFLVGSALIVGVWVVPMVLADTSPGAAPGRAVPAFFANLSLTALMAGIALATLGGHANPTRLRRIAAGSAGAMAVVLGLVLIDAAAAFAGHGPEMRSAVVGLWLSAGCSVLGGAAIVYAALRRGTRPSDRTLDG